MVLLVPSTSLESSNTLKVLVPLSLCLQVCTSQWAPQIMVSQILLTHLVVTNQYAGVINKFFPDMTTTESCMGMGTASASTSTHSFPLLQPVAAGTYKATIMSTQLYLTPT